MILDLRKGEKIVHTISIYPLTQFHLFLIIRSILIKDFTKEISCGRKYLGQSLYYGDYQRAMGNEGNRTILRSDAKKDIGREAKRRDIA